MIPKLWFNMTEEQWQKERKRIRELQDRYFREKGDDARNNEDIYKRKE